MFYKLSTFAKTPHPSASQTPSPQGEGCPPGSWLSLIHRRKRRSPFPSGKALLKLRKAILQAPENIYKKCRPMAGI
ncbi:MAG: hypothetical protein IJM98_01705, partial [Oscillospiraceae bacterium]|nr:hypothetical protein [Oscillospiraceae bacterium]